jgi:AmiR/NasT family two-component response regulator
MRVLSLTADLLFASNIEATLGRAGHEVETVETLAELAARTREQLPDIVILDLHAGVEAADVVMVSDRAPVVAFGRHTEPALLRAAREAGCVAAVARSTFVEEMTALVDRAVSDGES